MIRKTIKDVNLREYFPVPLWFFPLRSLNYDDDDCLACLSYPTVSHFLTWNWWSKNEYSLSFSNLSGEPSLHPVSIQRKEMEFPLMIFRWAAMSVACIKENEMMVLMKKFESKTMFWRSFCILLNEWMNINFTLKCYNHLA